VDFNAPRWTDVPGTSYQVDARTAGGEWTRVRDGRNGRPFDVRFRLIHGRPRVLGVRFDDDAPVTARQLREPRITDLESAFGHFLAMSAADVREVEAMLLELQAGSGTDDAEDLHDTLSVIEAMRHEADEWRNDLAQPDDTPMKPRGRGASPPTDDDLRRLLRVLREQRLRGQRGAITRTARQIGMDRSTVYRWLASCEERGLLPAETGDGT
jgi:hypothetical protein